MKGSYLLKPVIPENIQGLIPRTDKTRIKFYLNIIIIYIYIYIGRIPTTARFFRQTSSFERNGMFNIHTPTLNVRYTSVGFFVLLGWGWCAF